MCRSYPSLSYVSQLNPLQVTSVLNFILNMTQLPSPFPGLVHDYPCILHTLRASTPTICLSKAPWSQWPHSVQTPGPDSTGLKLWASRSCISAQHIHTPHNLLPPNPGNRHQPLVITGGGGRFVVDLHVCTSLIGSKTKRPMIDLVTGRALWKGTLWA